jgi:RimJ/RimL family protein N-acetyltransferase
MNTIVDEAGTIDLVDGTTVRVRPIQPADAAALQRFHSRHSEASIYLRFFTMQRTLGDVQAKHFTELDGADRFALIALDPEEPDEIIGVARFDREPGTDRAEYAAIVADVWQGHGLGLRLTSRLIDAAKRRGITVFTAYVLPHNVRMLNLLRGLGLPETIRYEDGIDCIDVDLRDHAHDETKSDVIDLSLSSLPVSAPH